MLNHSHNTFSLILLFVFLVDPTAEAASPLGAAVGPERFEQLKALAGIDDPYDLSTKPLVRALAPEQANLVPSSYDQRVAGCVCMQHKNLMLYSVHLNMSTVEN